MTAEAKDLSLYCLFALLKEKGGPEFDICKIALCCVVYVSPHI